jgi:zinc-ribbon domain
MYCPNCGQQQMSDEMRFCSRCGFGLSGLAEWLAGGKLPAKRTDEAPLAPLSPRRKGIRRAAKLMFFSGVLFPVFLLLSLLFNEGGVMIFPLAIYFVSLVMMLYARLFGDPNAPVLNRAAQTARFETTNIPTPRIGRQQVRTNELEQPRSVTEHTTRLLE